jgi:protein-S-isoprenylcysteine O-methyltransferase Ste14
MYVAVVAVIVGQAMLFVDLALLVYAVAIAAVSVGFVRGYEEPTLRRQFGPEYDTYRSAVPGWWPRRRGWSP